MDKKEIDKSQQESDESVDSQEKKFQESDEAEMQIRKNVRKGKLVAIEMADGETFYLDTAGMKSSEIEEFKNGIFEFTNGEMVQHDKRSTRGKHKTRKTASEKTKSQKSSKIK